MTRRSALRLTALAPLASYANNQPVPLFDGTTLRGWTVVDGPESAFYVRDGAIVIHEGSNFPTWLRSDRQYENFDLTLDVFIQGWANGGLYLFAPEHGRPTWNGLKINLFQKQDDPPLAESMGAIFPVIAPRKVNVRSKGEWNTLRVLSDWPTLRVWSNGELIHDLDRAAHPELRFRRRSGFLGIESLSYPLRFRNIALRELPSKERWTTLGPEQWSSVDGKPKVEWLGGTLRLDGLGYLATKARYRDFAFDCYIRGSRFHNGGIIFRGDSVNTNEHYEIQLHDVEGAVYPTGSLYHFRRCSPYPRIEPEQWFPFQLTVQDRRCVVRVNGDTVVDYDRLERLTPGPVMLQAHANGKWIEYKELRVREL